MSYNTTNNISMITKTVDENECKLFQSTSYIVQLLLGLSSFTVLVCTI